MIVLRRILDHCVHDCCNFHRAPDLKDEPVHVCGYCRVICAKFLLEVCGAAGAIWGSSDVLTLRRTWATNELGRLAAILVGLVFGVRFWWHAKHYFQHERDFPPIKLRHRRIHKLPFFQLFSTKFILEVLGRAGAIWGCSEALTLRDGANQRDWRIAAVVVGTMFAIRWMFQILSYCLFMASLWSNPSSLLMTMLRWYEVLIVKLILEVFGAVGAVWGFSEVVYLRNAHTLVLWRPLAIVTGVVFTGRWLRHVFAFARDERKSAHTADLVQPKDTHPEEVQDLALEISDLALTETSTTGKRTPSSHQTDAVQKAPETK